MNLRAASRTVERYSQKSMRISLTKRWGESVADPEDGDLVAALEELSSMILNILTVGLRTTTAGSFQLSALA